MTTATATTTAQNNKFSEQKQSLSTCVLNFGTFFFGTKLYFQVTFSLPSPLSLLNFPIVTICAS